MKLENIRVGMILRMHDDVYSGSAHADGTPLDSPYVLVTAIVERKGYKQPWIRCGQDSFKASDFACAAPTDSLMYAKFLGDCDLSR